MFLRNCANYQRTIKDSLETPLNVPIMHQAEKPWGFVLEPLFSESVGFTRDPMKRVFQSTEMGFLYGTSWKAFLGSPKISLFLECSMTSIFIGSSQYFFSMSETREQGRAGLFLRQKISSRLIKCNINDVFVNKLNFRLYILKSHKRRYQAYIIQLKKCVSLAVKMSL